MHLEKWIPALLALVILISGCLSAQSPAADPANNSDAGTKTLKGLKFYTALPPALEAAKAQNKTAFIYFRSDSCGWCKKFEEETFTNQSVIKILNEKFLLVTIDVYDQKNETRNFRVRGTPTMVFIDPNGNEIKRIPGYVETEIFLNTINEILVGNPADKPDAGTKTLKGLTFYTALPPALEAANAQNRIAFIYFRSDSCDWCKKFEEETFTNQSVIETLNEKFILATIDVNGQKNETINFRIRGTPTMVFIDSNGGEIKRISGYVEREIFLNTINGIAS